MSTAPSATLKLIILNMAYTVARVESVVIAIGKGEPEPELAGPQ